MIFNIIIGFLNIMLFCFAIYYKSQMEDRLKDAEIHQKMCKLHEQHCESNLKEIYKLWSKQIEQVYEVKKSMIDIVKHHIDEAHCVKGVFSEDEVD